MNELSRGVFVAIHLLQQICTFGLLGAALFFSGLTGAGLLGLTPWPELSLALGGAAVPEAGMVAQIGLTVLLLLLVGFLPANNRVRRLELTNRNFHISMNDVTRAYAAVHAADRDGAFKLSREFDAMRDRIAWLRDHTDLAGLEPDVLELAAQMSMESRDLASIYSTEKVERAHSFLRHRQQEIEDYRQRIAMAQSTVGQIRRWMQAVSVEEGLADKQIECLRKDLAEVTETLKLAEEDRPGNVFGLARRAGGGERMAVPAE